ncbi:RHS repeat domain-containing protein [Paenibacillus sp. TY11]|uniref:RHS repeat domain-containing protein n=1 Tax=Paenibacillus sp. TY11 TaxID=3448633 RepID=UPI0040393549
MAKLLVHLHRRQRQIASYGNDSASRLTKVSGEGKEVGYSYNGDGLLYERTEDGKTTRYYYDEEAKLIAGAEVEGGTKITYGYVYDLSGQLWARQDKASGQLQYYQFNGHDDVVGLSDSAGKGLNSYSYDIWGGPETVKETVPNVLRYAGEYLDDTTGLQYLRARCMIRVQLVLWVRIRIRERLVIRRA